MEIAVIRLPHAEAMDLPRYASEGSAGMDLMAAISQDWVLSVGERLVVPCGIAFALPLGFEAQVRPRSGLALKHGITCLNAPGTIDSDYRGEIKVILVNHGKDDFTISRHMRIAQLVIASYNQVEWQEVVALPSSQRGSGGFGSSGL